MMNPLHIIAEAGNNHGSKISVAQQLVDIAVSCGANSVKFQIIYPDGLYLPQFYENGQYTENGVFQQRLGMMLTDDEYREIAVYCKEQGIGFSSSVFDERGVKLLDELDVDYIKIASCDLNNSRLLIQAAERKRKLIISTGMATLAEVERAINDVYATGFSDIVLLHCVSIYPAQTSQMNLSFIKTLQTAFGFPVGLSDHTENSIASVIAASMGIEWIEKHFTYDRGAQGFDHAYAMEPDGFKQYIADVRAAEAACSSSTMKISDTEANTRLRARRGLFAARDLQAGEVVSESDILIVRPESPLRPNDTPLIIGRELKHTVHKFEPFSLDQFCS